MERRRRIGAYGLCWEGDRVLLTRASGAADFPGVWQLPGGGIEHGEDPTDALVREFAEETGLVVEPTGLQAAVADVIRLVDIDVAVHTDRLVYDVSPVAGSLCDEPDGTTDRVAWVAPDELAGLPLMPFTAELLGRPVVPLPEGLPRHLPREPLAPAPRDRGQRFAAYGLVTDPAGRILLTLIAEGYPGAGRWHLPGGGTDHGEQPVPALLRELGEEAGQVGRVTALLDVHHLHNPAAWGPEGVPMDWHSVRVIYRVVVDVPTEPTVTEAAGGSTAKAAWFTPADVAQLRLTDVAEHIIGQQGR